MLPSKIIIDMMNGYSSSSRRFFFCSSTGHTAAHYILPCFLQLLRRILFFFFFFCRLQIRLFLFSYVIHRVIICHIIVKLIYAQKRLSAAYFAAHYVWYCDIARRCRQKNSQPPDYCSLFHRWLLRCRPWLPAISMPSHYWCLSQRCFI